MQVFRRNYHPVSMPLQLPMLPAPPSWYPGHMTQFARALPALLRRTDVVLELRDARLPLTSINRNFEGQSNVKSVVGTDSVLVLFISISTFSFVNFLFILFY